MARGGQPVERLRDYLRTLKPETQAMLAVELERSLMRGEDLPGHDLVLQELRRAIRGEEEPAPRLGDAARLFFAPFEPFLADGAGYHKRHGRLPRIALEPIWDWIGRDLMPAEAKVLSDDMTHALLAEDRAKAAQSAQALHALAIPRIKDVLAAAAGNEKIRRRLDVEVGTPRALEDIGTLFRILAIRDVLVDLARRLPGHLRVFEREEIEQVIAILDGASALSPAAAGSGRKADIIFYGLILVMHRLEAPWQLIRIAIHAAGSDDGDRVAATPYAAAVTLVLDEVEYLVSELRAELKARRGVASLLKGIHDAARGLHTELNLAVESPWSRRLAAIRTDASNVLKAEIESTPGRVRRLLQPRRAREIAPGSRADATEVSDAEMLVEFVSACRQYAGELAVNEATARSYSELQQYLETSTKILLDALRHAGDTERPFRQSQAEAAIRLCRIVFGADYAGLLAKSAEIALQVGAPERKSARA